VLGFIGESDVMRAHLESLAQALERKTTGTHTVAPGADNPEMTEARQTAARGARKPESGCRWLSGPSRV